MPAWYTRPTSKPVMSGSSSGARRAAHALGASCSWVSTSTAWRSIVKRSVERRAARRKSFANPNESPTGMSTSASASIELRVWNASPMLAAKNSTPYIVVACSSLR